MDHKFNEAFLKRIDEAIETYSNSILADECEDFYHYKKIGGVLHGLRMAKAEFLDLTAALMIADD